MNLIGKLKFIQNLVIEQSYKPAENNKEKLFHPIEYHPLYNSTYSPYMNKNKDNPSQGRYVDRYKNNTKHNYTPWYKEINDKYTNENKLHINSKSKYL